MITPDVSELLVIRKSLHANEIDLKPSQMKQILHIQCIILGKACELVVNEGIYMNVASMTLFDKLHLPTKVYPIPYTL